VEPDSGGCTWLHDGRWEATWRESRALRLLSAQARARAQITRHQARRIRSRQEVLRYSALARLQARMATMPVIEQAKGIIMAQQRCGPEEAFDLLRRASQRVNVKLHVLAAQIVDVASGQNGGNVTPISLGATRYLRA
jgi:ANTAR domain